jgi:phospholipase D1/2
MYSGNDNICIENKIRFDSYAPIRENINAKWYVDGESTFSAIADAIESAKETIFITDWFLVPELYLRRGHPASISNRLDRMLKKKAMQGVRIYVLLWNETSIAVKLNSAATKRKLEMLHENILVIRHPPLEPLNWSHHQKTVVVDHSIAFVGGLDLCYGRWDTRDHPCTDDCHLCLKWPGKDYINPHKRPIDRPELPFKEHIDRLITPRMGWHDIAMSVGKS